MTAAVVTPRVATTGIAGRVSGAVLRTFRRRLGYQQDVFAGLLGVDLNTYRSWEHGRRPLAHLPVFRLKALCRALVAVGVPAHLVGALDVAIELDIDIARALESEENIFPPDGCGETWQALLLWTLTGRTPLMFLGWRRVEPPRLCAADQRVLLVRCGWEVSG